LNNQRLEEAGIIALADLPSIDVLRGKLLGLINAPATKLAILINTPASQLAQVIKAKSEQKAE
jgi:large subunit ribosomal protein L10